MSTRTLLFCLTAPAALVAWALLSLRTPSTPNAPAAPVAAGQPSAPAADFPSDRAANEEPPAPLESLSAEARYNIEQIIAARRLREDLAKFYRHELIPQEDIDTLSALLARSPGDALAWIAGSSTEKTRDARLLALALLWGKSDATAAWTWATAQAGEILPVAVLVGAADDADTVRRLALPWLGADSSALDRRAISVYEALTHTPNAATANALADVYPGVQREFFFVRSFGDWSAQAPLDALGAVDRVQDAGERSRAFAAVVQHWPTAEVEDLQVFSQTIKDENMRITALTRVATLHSRRKDLDALRRWIAANPELKGYPVE